MSLSNSRIRSKMPRENVGVPLSAAPNVYLHFAKSNIATVMPVLQCRSLITRRLSPAISFAFSRRRVELVKALTQAEHAATLIPDVVRTFHKYLNAGSIHRKDPRFSASRLDFPRTDGRFVPTAPKSGATRVLPKGERLLEKLRTKLKRFGTFQCLAPTSGSLQSRAPKQSV